MRKPWTELLMTAGTQGGYVTARQAGVAGYGPQHLNYHHRAGNLEKVGRGLYRVVGLPLEDHDELIRALLSTRGRDDRPRAVLSHRTALVLYDLSDLFADRIHLTVPTGFRSPPAPGVVLHRARLKPSDTTDWLVGRITTPLRTLLDAGLDVSIPTEQLAVAIDDALEKGLISRSRLREAAAGRLEHTLREGKR